MDKLRSRKFWMAIATGLLIIANEGLNLNLPNEAIMTIVAVIITYILGQSYVDRGNNNG